MQRRQSPLHVDALQTELCPCRKSEPRAAFQKQIPGGEQNGPDRHSCAHTQYWTGSPEANLKGKNILE
jgi:hypothetical protein